MKIKSTIRSTFFMKMGFVVALPLTLTAILFSGSTPRDTENIAQVAADRAEMEARYGSIPKGIMLEGAAQGFPPISGVEYVAGHNRFVLNNGAVQYESPVSRTDLNALARALAPDAREIGRAHV